MLLPTVASACAPRDHVAAAVAALAALTREVQVFEVAAPAAAATTTAGGKGGKAGAQRLKIQAVELELLCVAASSNTACSGVCMVLC
jgi:hypothetical protein